ncbi:MAG: acyl-CoA desaturase [Saprospirales bacterium]|nr:acyl-CoA desaturase [Saprospirales bacterium]MBK8492254.1 acyl-CoA desaturase [Saprospirales bacterium]
MTHQDVHFDPTMSSEFFQTLRKRIDQYFRDKGVSKKANALMVFKSLFFFAWLILSYFSLLFLPDLALWGATLLFISMGLGSAFFIISVGHDASHGAYSSNTRVNKLLSYSWNLVGISNYMWSLKHNMSHHSFTNVPEHDPDISQNKLMRLNPDYPYRPFYRYQHYYGIFLYGFLSLFIVYFKDFLLFREHQFGNKFIENHGAREWVTLLLSKVFYVAYSLLIPLLVLPYAWWQILLMYLASHFVAGISIALMLVPPHINPHTVYTAPDSEGNIKNCWATHQIESTIDLSAGSWLVNWFTGGLNTHIVHHIFPNICHIHYRALTPIIEETAKEFGIKYTNLPFFKALHDHFLFLRELGQHPEAYHSRVLA